MCAFVRKAVMDFSNVDRCAHLETKHSGTLTIYFSVPLLKFNILCKNCRWELVKMIKTELTPH